MYSFRTLESLRNELSSRLGFGASVSASAVNAPILNSFLRNAQEQIADAFNWKYLLRRTDITIGVSQSSSDYPAGVVPWNISRAEIYDGQLWWPVAEGIDTEDRNSIGEFIPRKIEYRDQIETWPAADQIYTLRVWYYAQPARLEQDNDRASLFDGLVFLHALTNAKAHYRQPDAAQLSSQLNYQLQKLKGKSRIKTVHRRNRSGCDPYLNPPNAINNV